MSEMDPQDAAAFATESEDGSGAFGEDLDETGGDEGGAGLGFDGPVGRLFDGDAPGPEVGQLRADYEMPQWMAVAARGVLRVATGSGVPPVFEILVGSVMGIMQAQDDQDTETQTTDGGSDQDAELPAVGGEASGV